MQWSTKASTRSAPGTVDGVFRDVVHTLSPKSPMSFKTPRSETVFPFGTTKSLLVDTDRESINISRHDLDPKAAKAVERKG